MKRILIVEHDVPTCLAMSDLLGEFGFETGVADSSVRALSTLAEADPLPDVILLNINMPHMDGWKLREALRLDSRYNKIPILTISGGSCVVTELTNPEKNFPNNSLAYKIVAALMA